MDVRKASFDKNLFVKIDPRGESEALAFVRSEYIFSPLYHYKNYSGAAREYFVRCCLEFINERSFEITKVEATDSSSRHITIKCSADSTCDIVEAVNDLNDIFNWMLDGLNSRQTELIRNNNTQRLPEEIKSAVSMEISRSLKAYGTEGYKIGQEFDDFAGILAGTKINSNCWHQDYKAVGSSMDAMLDPENRLFDISHVAILPLSTDDSSFVIYNGWYFTIGFNENRRAIVKPTNAEEVKMIIDQLLMDHPELKADPKVKDGVKEEVKSEVTTESKPKSKTKKSTSKSPSPKLTASNKAKVKAKELKSAKKTTTKKTTKSKENENAQSK